MNDTELDEMLDQWTAPPVPSSLRQKVRMEFAAQYARNGSPHVALARKGWFAGAMLAAGMFLLVITRAFPQVLGLSSAPIRVPWTVDSEFVRYAADGSTSIEMYSRSYENNANEVILSRSMPGDPFKTAVGRTLDVALPAWSRLVTPFMVSADLLEERKRARTSGVGFVAGCDAGCLVLEHYGFAKASAGAGDRCIDGAVVDRATILNHPTAAAQRRWTEHGRMIFWMAPDLACFALRVTFEEQRADGTFHLVRAKQALKVNVNP